mgnify:CR=1 FL=1
MTYWQRAAAYADAVLNGDIPANVFIKLACERFVKDLQRDDIYPSEEGERWCRFLERLPHVKGPWASRGETLKLGDWQIFATINLYGWYYTATNLRRYREGFILVPRKNGKSFWVSGLALGHLCIDGAYGAEVYCGAASEKQAYEVFKPARLICKRLPGLRERFGIEVNAKSLNRIGDGSSFAPVIGNPGDGSSPSAAIVDEYHEHKTNDQVDTFVTGMGAREQPMLLQISTAGSDIGGPCHTKQMEVQDILRGSIEDDTVFGLIYGIDEDDEWDTIEAQKKANPNYGVSVGELFLETELKKAKRSATYQNRYRTKYLNQWVGAKTAWMNMLAYQKCRNKDLNIESMKGRDVIVTLDLASRKDFAEIGLLFPKGDKMKAFVKHYLPEDTIHETTNKRLHDWHAAGWIETTEGNTIDFQQLEDKLIEIKRDYNVIDTAYDPFQATYLVTRLQKLGFPLTEFKQNLFNMSEPMHELEALILEGNIEFEYDPVLMWQFGNVVAKVDAKGKIYPNKERDEAKIDGVVSIIMGVGRKIVSKGPGLTKSRGVIVI